MNTEKTTGLCVPLKQAEKTRKYLSENKILRTDLKINKDNKNIYFPVKTIPKKIENIPLKTIEKKFEKHTAKPRSYKETILIPGKLRQKLPTSYDIIGDIILIKLPKDLLEYKEEIGESLLKTNKNVKTVCLTEPVSGELRTRNIKVIAGENRTKTIHKEYNLVLEVDVRKTYFSPRLASERKHVADLVKPDEVVVDMFTGVAPFPVMIAKYSYPKIVYAIDKNLDAVRLARENIKINNVLDKVEVIHADAKKIENVLSKKCVKANRVIMNLPFSAYLFFPYALQIAADSCVIHYYDILKEEKIEERINNLKKVAEENGFSLKNVDVRKIKTYAPREFYIGIDITGCKK